MPEKMCGCGHEEAWHDNGGACRYGCGCERFHSRRTRELDAVARAELTSPRGRRDAAAFELATSALRSLDRAQDAINDARKKLQAIIVKEARLQGPPPDAGNGVPLHIARRRETLPAPTVETVLEERPKTLGRCEHALLTVLAARAFVTTNRMQLAVLSDYSASSSSFANGIGRLRSLGLIEGRGTGFAITEIGKAQAGAVELVPPAGPRLVAYWSQVLGRCELSLLGALVETYPKLLSREEVAGKAGYSPTSSSVANALGRLRSLELIDGPQFSRIRASPALVDEPVRIGKCDLCGRSGQLRPVPGFGANLHCEKCSKEITEASTAGAES